MTLPKLVISLDLLQLPFMCVCVCVCVCGCVCVCVCNSLCLPQCYLFHMYVGVRAGGGIGDEIEDPAGDEYELYRVVFDITFFFFVIVILLAIIQGLIEHVNVSVY